METQGGPRWLRATKRPPRYEKWEKNLPSLPTTLWFWGFWSSLAPHLVGKLHHPWLQIAPPISQGFCPVVNILYFLPGSQFFRLQLTWDPKIGGLEDDFSFQLGDVWVPAVNSSWVYGWCSSSCFQFHLFIRLASSHWSAPRPETSPRFIGLKHPTNPVSGDVQDHTFSMGKKCNNKLCKNSMSKQSVTRTQTCFWANNCVCLCCVTSSSWNVIGINVNHCQSMYKALQVLLADHLQCW